MYSKETIKEFQEITSKLDKSSIEIYLSGIECKLKDVIEHKIRYEKKLIELDLKKSSESLAKAQLKYVTDEDIVNYIGSVNSVCLTVKSRKKEVVYVRYVLYFYFVKVKGHTLQYTADLFGQNHATVLNGLKQHNNLTDDVFGDLKYKTLVENIFGKIEKLTGAL